MGFGSDYTAMSREARADAVAASLAQPTAEAFGQDFAGNEVRELGGREASPHDSCDRVCWHLRIVFLSLLSAAPFYLVLDKLDHIPSETFVACNDHPCNYIRLFGLDLIPTTGGEFRQVQNGLPVPIHMNDQDFTMYAVIQNSDTPQQVNASSSDWFAQHPEDVFLKHVLQREQHAASLWLGRWTRLAFGVTDFIFQAACRIMRFVTAPLCSTGGRSWEAAPAFCPWMKTEEEMKDKCRSAEVKADISNHLTQGLTRQVLKLCLLLWALLKCAHDIMLEHRFDACQTLQVGCLSAVFQGCATASIFIWAMGAAEVFVAQVHDDKGSFDTCVCYYQLPPLDAFLGLVTPFALLATFVVKVQAIGKAALHGDYIYSMVYDVPYHLVRLSQWRPGTLVCAKLVGHEQLPAEHQWGKQLSSENVRCLRRWQVFFHAFQKAILVFVAWSSSPFCVRVLETLHISFDTSPYITESPLRAWVMKWIVFPAPSMLALAIGASLVCMHHEYAKVLEYTPCTDGSTWPSMLCKSVLVLADLVTIICSLAIYQNLFPPTHLLEEKLTEPPPLVQAAVWGSASFLFTTSGAWVAMAKIYPLDHDIFLLGRWEEAKSKNESPQRASPRASPSSEAPDPPRADSEAQDGSEADSEESSGPEEEEGALCCRA